MSTEAIPRGLCYFIRLPRDGQQEIAFLPMNAPPKVQNFYSLKVVENFLNRKGKFVSAGVTGTLYQTHDNQARELKKVEARSIGTVIKKIEQILIKEHLSR